MYKSIGYIKHVRTSDFYFVMLVYEKSSEFYCANNDMNTGKITSFRKIQLIKDEVMPITDGEKYDINSDSLFAFIYINNSFKGNKMYINF